MLNIKIKHIEFSNSNNLKKIAVPSSYNELMKVVIY